MHEGFNRHILKMLRGWKSKTGVKPLVLRGARQVGKTTLIRQFSKEWKHYIEFNAERLENIELISRIASATDLMDRLGLDNNIPREEWKDTLLFIDEIQESPRLIGLLRYFYEDIPELHVIAAGSLLEMVFDQVKSFPVGRIEYIYLFPLNFQEYLEAAEKKLLLTELTKWPISNAAHSLLMEEFNKYLIIGGMPEIVSHYLDQKSMADLLPIYSSIWDTYKDDIPKYAKNNTEEKIIKHILATAPQQINKRITFENFGNSTYRSREVGEAFRSLDDAKVIQIIYPTTDVKSPPSPNTRKSPRLQYLDTGILCFDLRIQDQLIGLHDLSDAYRGGLVPHIILQEIISIQESRYRKPMFWVRDKAQSGAEIDLVYSYNDLLIPIEIKSGKVGKLRSLHSFIDRVEHNYAIRIYGGKASVEKHKTSTGKNFHLLNLPYYMGTLLPERINTFIEELQL